MNVRDAHTIAQEAQPCPQGAGSRVGLTTEGGIHTLGSNIILQDGVKVKFKEKGMGLGGEVHKNKV